jgi:hypothetical protein
VDLGEIKAQVKLDIRQAVASYATLRAQNAKTVYAMRGTGDSFVAAGRRMTTAGVGLLAVFGLAVKKAADFERKMDFFQAVTGTSAKQICHGSTYWSGFAEQGRHDPDRVLHAHPRREVAVHAHEELASPLLLAVRLFGGQDDAPIEARSVHGGWAMIKSHPGRRVTATASPWMCHRGSASVGRMSQDQAS